MRKIILCIFFIVSSLTFSQKWYTTEEIVKYQDKLEAMDVLVFNKIPEVFTSQWGHLALVAEDHKLVDFPRPSIGYRERVIEELGKEKRNIRVLRYREMTKELREELLKNLDNYIYYNYFVLTPPSMNNGITYCSHFVYNMFKDKVGDVLEKHGYIIMPYDFLESSKYFEEIDLER